MLGDAQEPVTGISTKTPNFLILGAAKSGTSALWYYLRQHPQVYMAPRKHTRFFAYDTEYPNFRGPAPGDPGTPYSVVDIEDYHALFDQVTNETAVGETSWTYLYRPEAPERIRKYAQVYTPDVKLIAILRHPVDRAYSHYKQNSKNGRESVTDFVQALETEEERIRDRWWPEFHYVQVGLYSIQLKRYFDLFDSDQIKVYLYEDFDSDPSGFLRDVFRFLEVDDTFTPEAFTRYNSSGTPKSKALHLFLQQMRLVRPGVERFIPLRQRQRLVHIASELHQRNLTKPRLSPDLRRSVIDRYFREDILALQDLIQRDLSPWLE